MISFSDYGVYLRFVPSLLVLMLASLICFRKWLSPPHRFPPGPPSLPIIGHLHLLGPLPHQSLYRLSQSYGPLMRLRLGSIPLLVVSSSTTARQILKTHDSIFASRPWTSAGEFLFFGRTDMAFAPYGPYWRAVRQLCNLSIFSSKGSETFTPKRAAEVNVLVRSIYEDSIAGRETQVVSKVMSATNNVITRASFGKSYTELTTSRQNPSLDAMSVLREILELLAVFNIGDYIPYLHWLDLQGYVKRMKVVRTKLQLLFQEIINNRRELRLTERNSPKDLLDVLLYASQESGRDVPISDDNIKAVLLDMFIGGTETSSVTVEWALAELLNNPKIMKKLQSELDTVVGSEQFIKELDIEQLPYLQAVVKETLRLHAPVPMLLPRESMKPCKVEGYDIPAKTQVYVNAWAISRDPNAWERPLDFWPERFMQCNVDVNGQHLQLIPFGAGRRACPGQVVGLQNVQMMLGSIVQGFDWHLPSSSLKDELLDMTENFVLTLRMASPIVAQASPRLPPHLYSPQPQQ